MTNPDFVFGFWFLFFSFDLDTIHHVNWNFSYNLVSRRIAIGGRPCALLLWRSRRTFTSQSLDSIVIDPHPATTGRHTVHVEHNRTVTHQYNTWENRIRFSDDYARVMILNMIKSSAKRLIKWCNRWLTEESYHDEWEATVKEIDHPRC